MQENVIKHPNGSTKKCHYGTEMVVLWKLNKLTGRDEWQGLIVVG